MCEQKSHFDLAHSMSNCHDVSKNGFGGSLVSLIPVCQSEICDSSTSFGVNESIHHRSLPASPESLGARAPEVFCWTTRQVTVESVC